MSCGTKLTCDICATKKATFAGNFASLEKTEKSGCRYVLDNFGFLTHIEFDN